MKKISKYLLISTLLVIVFITALIILGLWGANGNLLTFIKGQSDPGPQLNNKAITLSYSQNTTENLVTIDTSLIIAETLPEYISFALDISQVVGGKWWNPEATKKESGSGNFHAPVFDFNRPILDTLVKGLRPAWLRIGGSESDKVYYQIHDTLIDGHSYESVLTAAQWDKLNQFTQRNGLKFMFTLNAGPSSRNEKMEWNSENAEQLMAYSASKNYRVDLWELGNELNLFWYIYGPSKQLSAEQYDADIDNAKILLNNYYPKSDFAGQGSAIWPLLGEPLSAVFGFAKNYIKTSGQKSSIISFHYYPQQSRRGPIASRRAYPGRLLNPENLDEIEHWLNKHKDWRDKYAPGKEIWLGETGNAQFGGEPGLSDVYLSGLWWLDQLGLLAKNDVKVVVRQTLSGMTYGMIDDETLFPRTDYWNAYLWKRLMGTEVLQAKKSKESSDKLRVYAHKAATQTQMKWAILLINLDHENNQLVRFPEITPQKAVIYELSSPDIFGKELLLNNRILELNNNQLPAISGKELTKKEWGDGIKLAPLSYAFVLVE